MTHLRFPTILLLLFSALPAGAQAADMPRFPDDILLLPAVSRYGRNAVPVDPVQAKIVAGSWTAPKEGDTVTGADGKDHKWVAAALKDGSISHAALNGGYAFATVASPADRLMLLEAAGHAVVFVNGEPRVGDVYSNGYVLLPVHLKKGENHFLFQGARGSLRAKLVEPKSIALLHLGDMTTPDLVVGNPIDVEAAVVVLNATAAPAATLAIEAKLPGGKPTMTEVPFMLPLGMRKVGFRIVGSTPEKAGAVEVALRLVQKDGDGWKELDTAKFNLEAKPISATRRVTFRSGIDGSVQYYAVVPAKPASDAKPGLVLTLHGASVEGIGQAAAYGAKPGLHIVAPTNRRPYGFDWEDWGRLDAMEVLDKAERDLGTDPARTYLTGHSMGGHGTWHIGVTFPARFAAIGPSAGWVSMWSYAGAKRAAVASPADELVLRAMNPSDTLSLAKNYGTHGVFVLHGDADDNVPVAQARTMRKALAEFHRDFTYFEQPGAGHWWGNACVDWPAMFQFFNERRVPPLAAIRAVNFRTANPGVSAECHWLRIEAQTKSLMVSGADLRCDFGKRLVEGTTENVARLSLGLAGFKDQGPLAVHLDGQKLGDIPWPTEGDRLTLTRNGDKWAVTPAAAATMKGPKRSGPFRDAFRNRMVFVYGTHGTAEENAWALRKARFDAEQFWYRGNGSIDVIPDSAFDAKADRDRNVILYGNTDSNAAWKMLLADSPIQVRRGTILVGDREEKGDDLGILFVRPRPGSDTASVGVVSGSGVAGMRVTDRLPYFVSGVGYPDWTLLGADTLKGAGVRAAGYFGGDWTIEKGESAWRK